MADWLGLVRDIVLVGAGATLLIKALQAVRQSKQVELDIADGARAAQRLFGDKHETENERKRRGTVGDVEFLMGITQAQAEQLSIVRSQNKAILRGMGLPSDLSDPDQLQAAVEKRLKSVKIDHLSARKALIRGTDFDRGEGGEKK